MSQRIADPKLYVYRPLDPLNIRILHLQPGEPHDSIFIEVSHEKLDAKTIDDYHALSWQWGTEKETAPIRIKNKDSKDSDVQVWYTKPNLVVALKRLRWNDKIRRLWVDAICINQDELDKEKANQIAIMNQIYGTAEEVCVWLGEESNDSGRAIDFINKLADLKDFDSIAALEKNNPQYSIGLDLKALVSLLRRGWFSRRWVVQVCVKSPITTVLLTISRRSH
jgi:hypothetical protein